MTERESTTQVTITVAARRTGLRPRVVRRFLHLGLVSDRFTEEDLAELRRVRRLRRLGVNLAGVEVVLRMRRRILELEEISQ
jgi:DNA-binding transcriptional MerR regulator